MGAHALGKLRGRYSIEAWGARLGMPKIGTEIEDWSRWTPDMQERCIGDVAICKTLWHFLRPDGYSQQAMELEHRAAVICDEITTAGVPFDDVAAAKLHQQWTERRAELAAQLQQQFPGTKLNSRKQIGALLEARGWVPEQRTEKTKQPKIDAELLETIPTTLSRIHRSRRIHGLERPARVTDHRQRGLAQAHRRRQPHPWRPRAHRHAA